MVAIPLLTIVAEAMVVVVENSPVVVVVVVVVDHDVVGKKLVARWGA